MKDISRNGQAGHQGTRVPRRGKRATGTAQGANGETTEQRAKRFTKEGICEPITAGWQTSLLGRLVVDKVWLANGQLSLSMYLGIRMTFKNRLNEKERVPVVKPPIGRQLMPDINHNESLQFGKAK